VNYIELEKLKTTLETKEQVTQQNIAKYREKIDKSRIELNKILTRKQYVQNNIGLNGTVLIQFLIYLRLFAMEIVKTTSIYSMINSILNGNEMIIKIFSLNHIFVKIIEIKSSIQCPIAMLNSSDLANVLVGQQMLCSQAKSLLAYSRDARKSIADNHHKRCWLIDINNHYNNTIQW
jgi:hypothetical protein